MIELKKGKLSHPSGKKNSLNNLTGSEWAQSSKSVMEYHDQRSKKQKFHGASFPQSLVSHHISIYTKKGQKVLDPFVGVGTTLDACKELGRKGIGIELNLEFVNLAKKDLDLRKQKIIHGDALKLTKYLKPNSVDYIITSPPYTNMLNNVQENFLYKWKNYGLNKKVNAKPYSSDLRDIGNMSYEESLKSIHKILRDTYMIIKDSCYATWIVKDFRDIKSGKILVDFHNDIIKLAREASWILWDIRIFDQTRFRPLIILGIPSRNFYLNIGHSYILTFKKDEKIDKK